MELTKSVRVGRGGRIELIVPGLSEGEQVDVRISTLQTTSRRPGLFGFLEGKLRINDNFDDPIPGLEEYT